MWVANICLARLLSVAPLEALMINNDHHSVDLIGLDLPPYRRIILWLVCVGKKASRPVLCGSSVWIYEWIRGERPVWLESCRFLTRGFIPPPEPTWGRLHKSERRQKEPDSAWLHLKPPEFSSLNDFQVIVHSSRNTSVCRHWKSRGSAYLTFLRRTRWQKSGPGWCEELAGSHVPTTPGFMSSITGGNLIVLGWRTKNVSPAFTPALGWWPVPDTSQNLYHMSTLHKKYYKKKE